MKQSFCRITLIAVVAIGFLGCAQKTTDDLLSLSKNPNIDMAGPTMLIGSMAAAAEYLQTGFDEISKVYKNPAVRTNLGNDSLGLASGQYLIFTKDTDSTLFGELVFENTSTEKVVLFLESFGPDRVSQGFSYVKLEPGNKFKFQHNLPPIVVKIVVIAKGIAGSVAAKVVVVTGAVIIIGEELKALVNSSFRCNLSSKGIQPDECVGWCTPPIPDCKGIAGSTRSYGPAWLGMAQPTACGCVP